MSFPAVITPLSGSPGDPSKPIHLPPGIWPHPPETKPPGSIDIVWPPQLPPLPPNVVAPPIALPPNLPAFPIIIPEPPGGPPIVMPPIALPPIIWPPIDPSAGLPPGGRSLVLIWIAGAGWRWLLVDLSQPKK
jgi:hypothetical protein